MLGIAAAETNVPAVVFLLHYIQCGLHPAPAFSFARSRFFPNELWVNNGHSWQVMAAGAAAAARVQHKDTHAELYMVDFGGGI